jgi:hypothetical protein
MRLPKGATMKIAPLPALVFTLGIAALAIPAVHLVAQVPQSAPAGPVFEVVSIKPNTSGQVGSTLNQRPDGGFAITNVTAAALIVRAYPAVNPMNIAGLPDARAST